MKVKDLIETLSKIDPTLNVVSCVDKYSTHRPVTTVEVGFFDAQVFCFTPSEEAVEDELDVNAVSIGS